MAHTGSIGVGANGTEHVDLLAPPDDQTWSRVSELSFVSLSLVDQSHGWGVSWGQLIGGPGRVLRYTSDGGRSWSDSSSDPCAGDGAPISVSFASARVGWVACSGIATNGLSMKSVWKTSDGGNMWALEAAIDPFATPGSTPAGSIPGKDYLSGVAMNAAGAGVMWEALGGALGTTDGGRTWRSVDPLGASWASAQAGCITNGTTWTLVLLDGAARRQVLERTSDAGRTWQRLSAIPLPG